MPTKTKRRSHNQDQSAGRYSGSDQQNVPDYGYADHEQSQAGKGHADQARRPWQDRPKDREGQYGYRRDEGAHGRKVDGESRSRKSSANQSRRSKRTAGPM